MRQKFTLSIGINYLTSAMQYRTDFSAHCFPPDWSFP